MRWILIPCERMTKMWGMASVGAEAEVEGFRIPLEVLGGRWVPASTAVWVTAI